MLSVDIISIELCTVGFSIAGVVSHVNFNKKEYLSQKNKN